MWWLSDDASLGESARAAIGGAESQVAVSAASAWEIAIKQRIGKLKRLTDLSAHLARERFAPIHVTFDHAAAAGALPLHHRDPFDRMLVAQGQLEGMTIVTADERIARYDIHVLAASD